MKTKKLVSVLVALVMVITMVSGSAFAVTESDMINMVEESADDIVVEESDTESQKNMREQAITLEEQPGRTLNKVAATEEKRMNKEGETQVKDEKSLMDALKQGGIIKIANNITVDTSSTANIEKKVTLDLNGNAVTWNTSAQTALKVTGEGNLVIQDKGNNGEMKCVGSYNGLGTGICVEDNGILELQNGAISYEKDEKGGYAIKVSGNAVFNMSGGKVMIDKRANYGIHLNSKKPSQVTGGEISFGENITEGKHAVYGIYNYGNMDIKGLKIDASNVYNTHGVYCLRDAGVGVFTISGGEYRTNDKDTSYVLGGENNSGISDGTFYGRVETITGGITGGCFSVEPSAQYLEAGKITEYNDKTRLYGIVDGNYVARIDTKGYTSWDGLFSDITDSETSATWIYIMYDTENITIPENKNVKLLNSRSCNIGKIENNGTCEIYLYAIDGVEIENNGDLIVRHQVGSITNKEGAKLKVSDKAVVTGSIHNKGEAVISGGKFLGGIDNEGDMTITGGSYKDTDEIEFDEEMYGLYKIKDNTYEDLYAVYEKDKIQAQVGEYHYVSWRTAAINATAKEPAKLLVNLTLSPKASSELNINSGANLYLDLNGHQFNLQGTRAYNYGFKISKGSLNLYNSVKGEGGIQFKSYNGNGEGSAIWMSGCVNDLDADYAVLRVADGVKITSDGYSINMMEAGAEDKYGVAVYFDGEIASKHGPYVNGQYNNTMGSIPIFNFYENAVINVQTAGIYGAGYAKWNIYGSTITGATGIEIRAGELNVSGGIITGNGEFKEAQNSSGSTVIGVGIAVSQHTSNLDIKTNISGGEINGGKFGLYEKDLQDGSICNVTMDVSGGAFNAASTDPDAAAVSSENKTSFISGGTFSTDVKKYVVDSAAYAKVKESSGTKYVAGNDIQEVINESGKEITSIDISQVGAGLELDATNLAENVIKVSDSSNMNRVAAIAPNGSKNLYLGGDDFVGHALQQDIRSGCEVDVQKATSSLSLDFPSGVKVTNNSGQDITVNGSTVSDGKTITSYVAPETPSEVTDAMIEAMQIPDVSDIGFDADDKAAIDNAREAYEKAIATNPAYEAILAPTLEKIEAAEAAYVAAKRTAFEATEPDIELSKDEFYYNKKAKTPDVVSGLEAFTEGVDYEITYVDNIKAGIGSVVIEGKGDLEGFSVSKDILIRPYKGVINKVTTKRNSMVVTSRDQSAGGITGYQFAWRVTNSGDDWKTKMTSTKNYKTTIKKLKANTRYTVKVRGIVKVDGTRYYGNWSKLSKIRTVR